MNKYGLVKTIPHGEDEIKLVGNAMTFILYKSYFGRDLLNDIVGFAKKNTSTATFEKIKTLGADADLTNLTADELAGMNLDNMEFDTEFILNFIAALIATAKYPEKLDAAELICSIPPHFVLDQGVIGELLDFLSLFISSKKKPSQPQPMTAKR